MVTNDQDLCGLLVFIAVIMSFVPQSSTGNDVAWELESQTNNSCLIRNKIQSSNFVLEENLRSTEAVEGDYSYLKLIADKISSGLVRSTFVPRRVLTKHEGVVDLPALVSNNFDDQLSESDDYWEYYTDCDRWNVEFEPEPVVPDFKPSYCSQVITQFSNATTKRVRQIQFEMFENLGYCRNFMISTAEYLDASTCEKRVDTDRRMSDFSYLIQHQPFYLLLTAIRSDFQKRIDKFRWMSDGLRQGFSLAPYIRR